jgi:hypothetical protein
MEHFLKSGKSVGYKLKVMDPSSPANPDAQKIGDIIVSKGKKFDQSMWLSVVSCDEDCSENQRYELSGSRLFAMMSPSPDPQMKSRRQRDVIYISASSGAGKSTWAGQYSRAWQRCIKERVVIFSAVGQDPAFEGVDLKRIPFDKLVDESGDPNDCVQIEDLKDCLVIFDDIDVIANKKLKCWIQALRNRCLEIGRHHNISMICTTHQIMNYQETKILLMEATKVVFFPSCGAAAQIKRYLKSYAGLSPNEIKDVFALKSRWVMLSKAAPKYIMHANGAYFLQ